MSKKAIRDFRPKIHFTPPENWMNDPNGMVYVNGTYHFCYQKYPDDTIWGPMHWGHAVTKDLINWEHRPIVLYPDEMGYIFSGSSVYDLNNTSGYGTADNPPIIAMFTNHNNETGLEVQSIAYSLDGGNHFEKSYLNPVIKNPGIADFRDPKVFWNTTYDCWSMVLAVQDRVYFYRSDDLKEWEKTGEFGPGVNLAGGVWECSDLINIEVDGKTIWFLIVSMTKTEKDPCKMQYFVGDFDGDTFVCSHPSDEIIWLDEGFDNYAAVTFQNYDGPLLMGWGLNWAYAANTPTGEYCGQATLARSLTAYKTKDGYRLAGRAEGIDRFRANAYEIKSNNHLHTETFGLSIEGSGDASLYLTNALGQKLVIKVEDDRVIVDRSLAGDRDFDEQFSSEAYSIASAKRLKDGNWNMEIIFDVSILELFADDGLEMITMVAYPDVAYDKISWDGDMSVSIWEINM